MDDEERIAILERTNFVCNWIATGLLDFSRQILAMVASHDEINDAILSQIKARCIANLKGADSPGLGVHRDANVERDALQQFEQFVDSAISQFRQNNRV